MDEKLLSTYSVEDIRKMLRGPRDEIVQTKKMSTIEDGKIVPGIWNLTRGEVLDAIESISKDKELIELILAESRKATKEIRAGALWRDGPYPYIKEVSSHFRTGDIHQRSAFGSFVGSFAGSFVIQKFGNKEDL